MSNETKCKCCHQWWYVSDIKDGLCLNCNAYITYFKRQLSQNNKYISDLKSKLKTKETETRNKVCDEIEKAMREHRIVIKDYCQIESVLDDIRRGEL